MGNLKTEIIEFKKNPKSINYMPAIVDFTAELVEKKYLTEDVLFLSFKVPETFSFEAGQFVMFKMEQQGHVKWKSYSVLSPPSKKGYLDFCAKIIEGGLASEFFKQMEIGQELLTKGPFGHFLFNKEEQEHWFVCTGTGITPFYSMICQYLTQFPKSRFTLLFGVRKQSNLLFHTEFQQLAKKYVHFRYIPTLSQEEWAGKTGRVQKHLPDNLQGKMFYICGLKELVLETQKLLLDRGVKPSHIKFERYT